MNRSNMTVIWLVGLFVLATMGMSLFFSNSSASAQAGQAAEQAKNNSTMGSEKSEEAKTAYKPTYPTVRADSRNSLSIQTDKHLYKPSEEVTVKGSILASLVADLGGVDSVTINVTDNKGTVVAEGDAQPDSEGMFELSFVLPEDAALGAYTVNASIQAEANILDTLDASVSAQLSNSVKFVVVSPVAFAVKAENKDFEVNIASNSSIVQPVEFDQGAKKISFVVEGESGTRGVAQVTLPKELLAGNITVSIDGRSVAEDSNDVIVTSDTASEMTLEINYPHSQHTIEIVGTSVVPEFPVSILVMAGALGSVIAVITMTRRSRRAHVM